MFFTFTAVKYINATEAKKGDIYVYVKFAKPAKKDAPGFANISLPVYWQTESVFMPLGVFDVK
jgi:hypothetical protein